jgi:nicotinamidase-related amidase
MWTPFPQGQAAVAATVHGVDGAAEGQFRQHPIAVAITATRIGLPIPIPSSRDDRPSAPIPGLHPAQTPHFQSGGVWPEHCVQGGWGAQLHPDLRVAGEVVRKAQRSEDGYSGFTVRDPVAGEEAATPLEELLRRRGIRRVVVRPGIWLIEASNSAV